LDLYIARTLRAPCGRKKGTHTQPDAILHTTVPPYKSAMANSLDLLEEKFRRVEEASERRALDGPELPQRDIVEPSAQAGKKHKRRGVSVSQFGKDERGEDGPRNLAPSPLSAAASKSTFYHTLANPRSVDSLVSENSKETRHGEEPHEIRVERINGRYSLPKTVGALLPRRLTRAQSSLDYVPGDRNMVIDVSVETTTESSGISPSLQMSMAYATNTSRRRAATVGTQTHQLGLVDRARDFARKLRRKSRAELS